ncbi:MAG TPA: leucine--tRNA ligase [Chloroflexota bacterium]|nr:leucine--tRNA ligase [Chloroflexota bacterium]
MAQYDAKAIEEKWNRRWEETGIYRVDLEHARRPFYNLMEFPYPSGEGLHVGHVYTYCGADTYGRFMRAQGNDVFQPMGFDSFGIHSENYALKLGINPMELTDRTVARFRETQMKRLGTMWDWSHEVVTSHPDYYKWTQWIFLQMLKAGMAYRATAPVTWCPSCQTVLANEQTEVNDQGEAICERCGTVVTQREMEQWFFRITAYADRLVDNLKSLDWPELSKSLQTEWIGRSPGAAITFPIQGSDRAFTVFTTRPDTIFGATYCVLAPEHPLVREITTEEQRTVVEHYLAQVARKTERERTMEREKTGVWTGAAAINPATGTPIPIWIADYVLAQYGTGAIMAVPAHDQRDFEFARVFELPIVPVYQPDGVELHGATMTQALTEHEGTIINSGPFSGLHSSPEVIPQFIAWLEARGVGTARTTYRLHDWLISRQRYWGPPIPVVYCARDGIVPVPESDLPVILPEIEHFRPTGTGVGPLAALDWWVNTTCPVCGGPARRETDVSDTFLDSAWYFLRYPSTEWDDRPFDAERTRKWLPVNMYMGGIEHVRRHHLYARFVSMVLHDLGYLPFEEPFTRLRLHGLLLVLEEDTVIDPVSGEERIVQHAEKMSKSRGNVVNPDEYIERYGADVLRLYLLFAGPYQEGGVFSDRGVAGISRFVGRIWSLLDRLEEPVTSGGPDREFEPMIHRTIKRVGDDLASLKFHTAIAGLMEHQNYLHDHWGTTPLELRREALRTTALLLAPLAPHLAEEAWERLGAPYSIHNQPWPQWDAEKARARTITLVVQVNGKVRDKLEAPPDLDEASARELALTSERVRAQLDGKSVRQTIYVPGKLLNMVVG